MAGVSRRKLSSEQLTCSRDLSGGRRCLESGASSHVENIHQGSSRLPGPALSTDARLDSVHDSHLCCHPRGSRQARQDVPVQLRVGKVARSRCPLHGLHPLVVFQDGLRGRRGLSRRRGSQAVCVRYVLELDFARKSSTTVSDCEADEMFQPKPSTTASTRRPPA